MPDPRYRVLFVASHPVQYQSPNFRLLAAKGDLDFHVAYCTLRGAESARDPEFGVDVQWDVPLLDGYPWSEVPNRGSGRESFLGLWNPGLWKLIRRGNYDAVVSYLGYVRASFWIARLAAKFSNAAFLFGTDATSLAPRDGRQWKASIKKLFWPPLFRLADQVIALSSLTAQMMRELQIPGDHISLIPFVVDNDWWLAQSRRADRRATRAAWGVSEEAFVVLFCAKLQNWKRPLDLVRAFAKASVPGSVLIFAGEGPLRSQIESEATALGIASQVRILGFVNQSRLPAVYSSSDLMVLPSEYEPFAVVVNEAMCCGCTVLVSDQVGARSDLVMPVSPDLVFCCGDIDALAASLKNLLSDRSVLTALATNARARIETWSPRENVAGIVEAVRTAALRKRRFSGMPVPDNPQLRPGPPTRRKTKSEA